MPHIEFSMGNLKMTILEHKTCHKGLKYSKNQKIVDNKTEKAFSPWLPELLLKLTMNNLTDNYDNP